MIIPDKPYMIVLGTSHTNGDCMKDNDKSADVDSTAYEQIAAHLGLELLNVGLSGCTNYDLLQATMELNHNGALNPNCKLFVLEPRLQTSSADVPYDLVHSIDYPTSTQSEYSSIGIIEGWGRSRVTQDTVKYQLTETELSGTTTRQQVSENIRIYNPSELKSKKLRDQVGWWFKTANAPTILKAMEYFKHYSGSHHELFDNILKIDAICTIVKLNNIEFRWQVFDLIEEIAELKNLYNTHTTLWESFMNVYGKEIKDEVGMVWIHNEAGEKELNPYFCECSHLSQLGHDKWRDNTLPYIVKALENSH